jgi:hypothetical protein
MLGRTKSITTTAADEDRLRRRFGRERSVGLSLVLFGASGYSERRNATRSDLSCTVKSSAKRSS